jgi:hypothetical protein
LATNARARACLTWGGSCQAWFHSRMCIAPNYCNSSTMSHASHGGAHVPSQAIVKPAAAGGGGLKGQALPWPWTERRWEVRCVFPTFGRLQVASSPGFESIRVTRSVSGPDQPHMRSPPMRLHQDPACGGWGLGADETNLSQRLCWPGTLAVRPPGYS